MRGVYRCHVTMHVGSRHSGQHLVEHVFIKINLFTVYLELR